MFTSIQTCDQVLQGSAVTQTVLGGLTIHPLVANLKTGWLYNKV